LKRLGRHRNAARVAEIDQNNDGSHAHRQGCGEHRAFSLMPTMAGFFLAASNVQRQAGLQNANIHVQTSSTNLN
jgi:hypothetical protein